jgi:hypothetical protein
MLSYHPERQSVQKETTRRVIHCYRMRQHIWDQFLLNSIEPKGPIHGNQKLLLKPEIKKK